MRTAWAPLPLSTMPWPCKSDDSQKIDPSALATLAGAVQPCSINTPGRIWNGKSIRPVFGSAPAVVQTSVVAEPISHNSPRAAITATSVSTALDLLAKSSGSKLLLSEPLT